jgi:hypothetical protein
MSKQAERLIGMPREDLVNVTAAKMTAKNLSVDVTKVNTVREIAPVNQLMLLQPRPAAGAIVDTPAQRWIGAWPGVSLTVPGPCSKCYYRWCSLLLHCRDVLTSARGHQHDRKESRSKIFRKYGIGQL